ncbi:MAG: pyridoxamine 5'-phosphate oxidase family protein [Hyphomicrobiaceae bacterium]
MSIAAPDKSYTAQHAITTIAELDRLYGEANDRSLLKEIDHISDHYRAYIEAAPFVVVATAGPEGLDCSPRGDPGQVVHVVDPKTLVLPDRRGNNRIDALRNLVRDPRVSLLFLIPGIDVTMRVNGRAIISSDPDLLSRHMMQGKRPQTAIVVTVERVYFQCPKALVRSKLWSEVARVDASRLPTTGEMLEALSSGTFDGVTYDASYAEHMAKTIY